MAVEVTLKLPEHLLEYAKRLGASTQQEIATVLAESLQWLWLTVGEFSPPSQLSDAEVLALANSRMDEVQNQRLGELQTKGKNTALTEAERYELLALLHIYQLGQLGKSEALAEAVRRGLREPLVA
ncbi:hypothetical protein N0824_00803 [Microcystis sp. 0824]|nr:MULTISPECIES: hypothetical protein [Microcystis]NCR82429.1 hypothetical protein [Microcystis aeruginosa K13-10]NCR86990.1 hypothetical protein [Microcystis aeruginosa K13-05]MCZ8048927.1 hypothetical protein [Microcystis sp. LE19-41.2A]MCZ8288656.1 hypothetical protein [Microcystis sp. LE19-59.1C]GBF52954.1 hypothetical protein N0824_00803 [Microcystis sp. 0824]